MTQEEKELLLQDICARLPYGLKVCCINLSDEMPKVWDLIGMPAPHLADILAEGSYRFAAVNIEESIRPYLRPMSSMTEDEIETYRAIIGSLLENSVTYNVPTLYNFLNSKHLDYNGLIFRGLALEAPEEMYVIK